MKRRVNDFVVCGMVSRINDELERRNIDPRDIITVFQTPRHITQYGPVAQSFQVLYIEEVVEERKDLMTELVKIDDLERRIAKIKAWFHTLDVEIKAIKHEDGITYAKIHCNGEEYLMQATMTNGRVSVSRENPKYSPFPALEE